MARYPRIDQPCPLDAQARRNINGNCGLCGKTVHCLDGRSDAERAELLRQASGPVCVSYRLAMGAALALAIAGPVTASPVDAAAPSQAASQAQTPVASENLAESDLEQIFVGGISRPGEAEWVDDDHSLPELPMRREPSPQK